MPAVPTMSEANPDAGETRLRKRIGIYGVTGDVMRLIPHLAANPGVEIVRIFADDPRAVRAELAHGDPEVAALVQRTLTRDMEAFGSDSALTAVIDAGGDGALPQRFPASTGDDLQFVSPEAAEMLWGRSASGHVAARPAETRAPIDLLAGLGDRIDRQIARPSADRSSADREGIAIATVRIRNPGEIRREMGRARIAQILECVRGVAQTHDSCAEVIGPIEEGELLLVLRDPGLEPRDRFVGLARSVARAVFDDEALNDPVRVSLAFGLACVPGPGGSVETLLAEARKPRVQMV
jgi:hypothetical protein